MALLQRSPPALGLTTGHSRQIIGFDIGCLLIATISVMLRIYARYLKRVGFVAEDYLVFAALFSFFVQTILGFCGVILGAAGHPQSTVSPQNIKASLQILAGQGPCYGLAMTCSKWSICLLYKRIFMLRSFRITTYIVMALVFGWGVLAFVVTWAFCVPIAYAWDNTIPGGHCANRDVGYLVVGIVDAITDFFILILPIPVIWNLQIPRARQISLIVIFGIAIFSMVVSAIRAYYTTVISFEDFTDTRTQLDVFSAIEPATSIVVASSLVLAPVLKKWTDKVSLSHSTSSRHSFRRIKEDRNRFTPGDIELGETRTAVQGPSKAKRGSNGEAGGRIGGRRTDEIDAYMTAGLEPDVIAVKREVLVQREA